MYPIPILEIYIDMLFVLNFMMDYFIFWMVGKIAYQNSSRKRLALGSFVASVLYCLVVMVPFLRNLNIVIYLLLLPLMPIYIIFRPKTIKQWLQMFVISNMTALVVGGMSYGIVYWIQDLGIISNGLKQGYEGFSIGMLLLSIFASYIIIQLYRYYTQKRNTGLQKLYPLKIVYKGKVIKSQALLDTGNKVYDPISKYPVIIAEYELVKDLLPESIKAAYTDKEKDITYIVGEANKSEFRSRIRLIPYHSLGNPNGLLLGFKADEVYITNDHLEEKPIENVIIAIYQYSLSIEDTYHALLHGDFVDC